MDSLTSAAVEPSKRRLNGTAAALLIGLASGAVAQSFGRFTLGLLLPAISDDLGLSNTVAGSLATVNVTAYLGGTLAVAATLAFGVAQMISPQIGGWLADSAGSFTPVFFLSSALAIVGVAAALQLPRT